MKFLQKLVLVIFDLIEKYYHQKRIISYINSQVTNLENFIDIGSHMGSYSDLIINNFKKCKSFMFEPQNEIFKKARIKYRNKRNVKLYNYAISNKKAKKHLFVNRHNLMTSLCQLNQQNIYLKWKAKLIWGKTTKGMIMKTQTIKTIKLSQIIKNEKIKPIDLVKIDTEGHELEVLEGMEKKIKNIKLIMIEFRKDTVYLSYKPKKIHNYLIKNNFELKKKFKFPFTRWEDRIYYNKNYSK